MTDYYEMLSKRSACGVDRFDDARLEMFEKFCEFLDSTGEEWSLSQIKTKFSYDDLRFYVTGSKGIQDLATALERYWFDRNRESNDD